MITLRYFLSAMILALVMAGLVGCIGVVSPSTSSSNAPETSFHITTSNLPVGTFKGRYATELAAEGGIPPYSWTTTGGQFPFGVTLNSSTGAIAGVPSSTGAFSFSIKVEDSEGSASSADLSLRISTVPSPVIADVSPSHGSIDGGIPVKISGSNFRSGATVQFGSFQALSSQVLSSTQIQALAPPEPPANVNVTVQNPDGQIATAANAFTFTSDVTPAPLPTPSSTPLQITTSALPPGPVQVNYTATLAATGGAPPYSWSTTRGMLPIGLALNSSTGIIVGTPSSTGMFSFTSRVQDTKGSSASIGLTINISPAPPSTPSSSPLQITISALPAGNVQVSYTATLAAKGGVPPYSWSTTSGQLPSGLTLNSSTGTISGTPSTAGTFSFTTRVQDSNAASTSATLSLNILAAAAPPGSPVTPRGGAPSSSTPGPVLTSTAAGVSDGRPVAATSADAFVDSIGLDTHWSYPSYSANFNILTSLLLQSGIRHVRDGAIPDAMSVLASSGIRETMVIDPPHGIIPNNTYWSGAPPSATYVVADYLKNYIPAGSVDALEMPNELDVFSYLYKWHPLDTSGLSTDPSSATYFGAYGEAVTRDSWQAIKSDPTLSFIKIIGPTVGVQAPSPYSPDSLYNYVDWGGFHPYPGRANTWTYPLPYDTITKYYWNSFQPSVNIAADSYGGTPLMFNWYQPAFTNGQSARLMMATETGYQTGAQSQGGISITAQAKYVPRLFAEYFRNGIVRTFLYEFYDEGSDATNGDDNFGLIYNNLSPKPAYTALASLLNLLADPGANFEPGTLGYSLVIQPNGSYTRTGYVHDLLLQKSNGDFYLLFWHEVSDTSNTDISGNPLPLAQRDIAPLPLTTTIALPAEIASADLYSYDQSWSLSPTSLSIVAGKITVQATDSISVIRLLPSKP